MLPLELRGLAWVAFDGSGYRSGLSGSGATFVLAPTEVGLAARGHRVLAADTAETSTLLVYDITTGEELMRLATDFLVDEGAIFGDQIYLSVRTKDGLDGGVWKARVGSPALDSLIPAGTGIPIVPGVSSRGPIKLSPGGKTLGSTYCSVEGCVTQITPVGETDVTAIADEYLAWLSDEVAIVIDSHQEGGKEIRAYSVADGEQLWKLTTEGDFYEAYFLADQQTWVESSREGTGDTYRYEVALIDTATGNRTLVASLSDPPLRDWRLQPSLSTDRLAVLLDAYSVSEVLVRGGSGRMRILDLQTRTLLPIVVPFSATHP